MWVKGSHTHGHCLRHQWTPVLVLAQAENSKELRRPWAPRLPALVPAACHDLVCVPGDQAARARRESQGACSTSFKQPLPGFVEQLERLAQVSDMKQ